MKYNPFNQDNKEKPQDPLDIQQLLTDNSRKAVITANGELQLQGNDKEIPSVELMKERYWGSFKALLSEQLALEARAMAEKFPQFNLSRSKRPLVVHNWQVASVGELFWLGNLTTCSKAQYQIAIVYPRDYPFGEIRAYILKPYLPATEHRFKDGRLCLYEHQGKGKGYESSKTTAITIVAWSAAWLHAYEIWRKNGVWPTLEANNE